MDNTSTIGLFNNRYTILDQIGTGGMGTVYRATDRLSGQDVALKKMLLSPDQLLFKSRSETSDPRVALAREFQVLASLRHPNVIEVLDYGFDEFNQPFFSMRLLENAQDIVLAGRKRDVKGKVELLIQLLQALAYLHQRGILHRDLKPGNVLVEGGELVQVLDFGLAAEDSEDGEIAGTLAYIAPEVLRHKSPTEASDLYAVGIIAYELLAGRHPFNTTNVPSLLHDVLKSEPDVGVLLDGIESSQSIIVESMGDDDESIDINKTNIVDVINHALGITLKVNPSIADSIEFTAAKPFGEQRPIPDEVDSSVALAGLVINLLNKDPAQRFQSANDVIESLCQAIDQPIPEESAAIRESFLQAAKFVGRSKELDQLKNALSESEKGNGSGWLIGGESGVGKSRLLSELRTYALVKGIQVLDGHGIAEGGMPYQFWRESMRRLVISTPPDDADASILKSVVSDIEALLERPVADAPELPPSDSQRRLIGAISSMYSRQTQPTLLILEDLHWGTESIAVLKTLSILVSGWSMLIVGSYRDDDAPDLPEQLRNMKTLKLERLDQEQIADLSASMLGDGGRDPDVLQLLQRETEGNTFFLVEVVRALAEQAGRLSDIGFMTLPASVFAGGIQKVVERRLARLGKSAVRPLEFAAIGGRFINLPVIEAALENGSSLETTFDSNHWLTECANAAVLDRQGDQWRFAHDKLREGVLSRISDEDTKQLYQTVAEAFERVFHAPDARKEHVFNLVHLWEKAGNLSKVAHYAEIAGDVLRDSSVIQEATDYYTQSLGLLTSSDVESTVETTNFVRLKLGEVHRITGNFEPARELFLEVVQVARNSLPELEYQLARGLQNLAHVTQVLATEDDPIVFATESQSLFKKLGDPAGEATAIRVLGSVAYRKGEYAEAEKHFQHGLEILPQGHHLVPLLLGNLEMIAEAEGDYELAEKYTLESLELYEALGDKIGVADSYMKLGIIYGKQKLTEQSKNYYEQTLAIQRELGLLHYTAVTLVNLGISNKNLGDYESSLACYTESRTIFEHIGMRFGVAVNHINTARVLELMDRREEERFHLAQAVKVAREIDAPPLYPHVTVAYARLEKLENRIEHAIATVSMVHEHLSKEKSVEIETQELLDEWKPLVTSENFSAAVEQGKGLQIEDILDQMLENEPKETD